MFSDLILYSGGQKNLILEATILVFFIDKVPFTVNLWIRQIDTNTNANKQQICPSVSIPKQALKLVLWPLE